MDRIFFFGSTIFTDRSSSTDETWFTVTSRAFFGTCFSTSNPGVFACEVRGVKQGQPTSSCVCSAGRREMMMSVVKEEDEDGDEDEYELLAAVFSQTN